ncbi:hypothetical protein DTW90_32215 [Neorhizobium sp. P12A]|uniref:hypothetical protein n=1 Tax=Neorhizobium sp. P12A TaxID=2268027 RepID=UPI0011EBFEC6|nr:hypothetical protein [Neorhizobium sp. P12A]KAA0689164.1 hypothetical protein DTW90_32215 [Neorhizobium sp. P12A]
MSEERNVDFDMQAAWLRRFNSDAESNLKAFALRLKEALPHQVSILESKSFFSKPRLTGVSIHIGDHKYTLEVTRGELKASVAMVVRGITLNTKSVAPADWFTQLAAETKAASAHAQSLSQSLSAFMTS